MKKTALMVLLIIAVMLPCFSFAGGQEQIIEDFEDTSIPADELFKPEDLSSWGIMPPDSLTYSAQGAQSGSGLLAVFGESGSTQTYWIEQAWVSEQLAPAMSEYKYFMLWVNNQTKNDLRITIVLAENLDPDPAVRNAGYLPVEEVYGVWEEDGYVDEFDSGPSLCEPESNPDASVYIPGEFKGYVYWALPETADELISQSAWGVGSVSSLEAVAAMQIDVRGTYGADGNSYLFDSLGLSNGWEQGAETSPAAGEDEPSASNGALNTSSAQAQPEKEGGNTVLYIVLISAAVIAAAAVIIAVAVKKKKASK